MADQGDKRSPEEKNGATATLLGDMLQATRASGEGQQLALLPADAAPADLPTERGRGRPPGARNKATEELRAWARARFGDPGLKLMELVFRDPAEVARELGKTQTQAGLTIQTVSAWDVQVKQAEWMMRLLPFFWAQMPAELKVEAKRHLAVSISATPGGPAGDREVAADPLTALLEIQGVSGITDAQLHVVELHAEPNSDDASEG